MHYLMYVLIALGAAMMVTNIYRYIYFLHEMRDVLSAGRRRDRIWKYVALVLLFFFLIGYVAITFTQEPSMILALILFGGSLFVCIVLTLMRNLLNTAKERSIDVAEVLIGVIDARDPNLNGHSRHVQHLTMALYRHLPVSMRRDISAVSLEYAALMHDVGKLGVPEHILNKPARLTKEEWEIMQQHPKIGVEILKPLGSFSHIEPWILYHHERVDGKGYYKLKGTDIPLAARIIAVADTYSAITMRRSYKAPRTHEEAIAVMREVAGSQLDAVLVDFFCTIPEAELAACAPEMIELGNMHRT